MSAGRLIGEPNFFKEGQAWHDANHSLLGLPRFPPTKVSQPASRPEGRGADFTPGLYRVSIGVQCRYQADGPKRQVARSRGRFLTSPSLARGAPGRPGQ